MQHGFAVIVVACPVSFCLLLSLSACLACLICALWQRCMRSLCAKKSSVPCYLRISGFRCSCTFSQIRSSSFLSLPPDFDTFFICSKYPVMHRMLLLMLHCRCRCQLHEAMGHAWELLTKQTAQQAGGGQAGSRQEKAAREYR